MADFKKAIAVILKHEGGFVNDADDPGGATNMGITFSVFSKYAGVLGLDKSVYALRNITVEQAEEIYRLEFWNKMQGDLIKDQQLATLILDGYVNMGANGIKIVQREAGVDADGIVGPNTLGGINAAAAVILFEGIKDARIMFYENLAERKPVLKKFLKGWLNRVYSFKWEKPKPL